MEQLKSLEDWTVGKLFFFLLFKGVLYIKNICDVWKNQSSGTAVMNERVGNLGIAPRLLEMSLQLMKGQGCQGCAAETLWSQPKLAKDYDTSNWRTLRLAVFFLMVVTKMSYWKSSEQYQQISTDLEFSQVYLSDGFILFTAFTGGRWKLTQTYFVPWGGKFNQKQSNKVTIVLHAASYTV